MFLEDLITKGKDLIVKQKYLIIHNIYFHTGTK